MSCQDVLLRLSPPHLNQVLAALRSARFLCKSIWYQRCSLLQPSFSVHLQSHCPVTQSSRPTLPFYRLFLVGNIFMCFLFFSRHWQRKKSKQQQVIQSAIINELSETLTCACVTTTADAEQVYFPEKQARCLVYQSCVGLCADLSAGIMVQKRHAVA